MKKRNRGRPPVYEPHISQLRLAFNRARAQAQWRGEQWDISVDYWVDQWLEDNRYLQKGRRIDDLVFCRKNFSQGWTIANTEICPRSEFLKRQSIISMRNAHE